MVDMCMKRRLYSNSMSIGYCVESHFGLVQIIVLQSMIRSYFVLAAPRRVMETADFSEIADGAATRADNAGYTCAARVVHQNFSNDL